MSTPISALPWPSAGRAWWAVAVFSATAILSYTDRQILSLLVDPMRAELAISDTQVSLLLGMAFAAVYSIAGLPLGRLADTLPRRWVIIAGVTIWSLATAASGFAEGFAGLFVARMVVGIGEAALAPAAMSMIADYFPPQRRGLAIGVFLMGMTVGSGVAIAIGGVLLELANTGYFAQLPVIGELSSWRLVLALLGIPGAVTVTLLLFVREPPRRTLGTSTATAAPMRAVIAGFQARAAILVPLYFAMATRSVGDVGITYWMPSLLARRYDYSPGEIGGMLGAVAIGAGIVGTVGGGWIADRTFNRAGASARLSATGMVMALALIGTAIGFAGTGLQALAFFALWTAMSTAAGAIGITALQDIIPNEMRGIGVALASFGNIFFGLGLGATLTALATDHIYRDPQAVGLSITTVVAPMALISLLLYVRAGQALRRSGEAGA